MSLIQGGSGFPFFAPSMYDYICGRDVCSIAPTVDEIPDAQLKTALVEVYILYNVSLCAVVSYLV